MYIDNGDTQTRRSRDVQKQKRKQNKTNQNNRMIDDLWHLYVPFFKTPFMSKLVCHFYII